MGLKNLYEIHYEFHPSVRLMSVGEVADQLCCGNIEWGYLVIRCGQELSVPPSKRDSVDGPARWSKPRRTFLPLPPAADLCSAKVQTDSKKHHFQLRYSEDDTSHLTELAKIGLGLTSSADNCES